MTTVRIEARYPDGTPAADAPVTIRLMAGTDQAGHATDHEVIAARQRLRLDANGQLDVALDANADLTPDGTYYDVRCLDSVWSVSVPTDGGPYLIGDATIQRTPPVFDSNPPSAGILAARPAADTVAEGTRYLATDQRGGQRWAVVGGAWVEDGAPVDAEGTKRLDRAILATGTAITGNVADSGPVALSGPGAKAIGLSLTVTVDATRPLEVEVMLDRIASVANADSFQATRVRLWVDGTEDTRAGVLRDGATAAVGTQRFERTWTFEPGDLTAGAHTFDVRIEQVVGGSWTLNRQAASGATAYDVNALTIREVVEA